MKRDETIDELLQRSSRGDHPLDPAPAIPDTLPPTLPIIPWSERPLLPTQTVPITWTHPHAIAAIRKLSKQSQPLVGLLWVPDAPTWEPSQPHPSVGCYVRIVHSTKQSKKFQSVVEAVGRFQISRWIRQRIPFTAQVSYPPMTDPDSKPTTLRAYAIAIINLLKELTPLNPIYSEEIKFFLNRFVMTEPSTLTDFAATLTTASAEDIATVLHTVHVERRMEYVIGMIQKEVDIIQLQAKIRHAVENRLTEQQRQFFLKEQLKAIQKELGISKDDRTADRERFEERIENTVIPESALKRIEEELEKLSILEMGSPEYAVTRNYVDLLTALPWNTYSPETFNLKKAQRILNAAHEGLEDIKARIMECIAVGALKGEIAGSIILLVGPPGVGKTSIGRCIASALGRKFYRFSVGGMRDEAEIKGHRRTYIGAMPGKIIHALLETGTANPVIMLDEIDKITASSHSDPASALLEVLDPEQQSGFLDHYLDVRFDLSKVLFICTANHTDSIPPALRDRMEIMQLSGYTAEEKEKIAIKHLWPKILEKTGLHPQQLQITRRAIRHVIDQYARESGVRQFEKKLSRMARKMAVRWVKKRPDGPLRIDTSDVEGLLGPPIFVEEPRIRGVGVATGLAWTALGGVTLCIEASTIHHHQRGIKLTGKLGSVMKESAEIAYSYVMAHTAVYHGDSDFFAHTYIHLHVPEGATPKDGPSAGITMASALLSLALQTEIPADIAMSGELTLTGQVLPVGGIREKLIAAKRSRCRDVILPAGCRGDFDALPTHIRTGLTVYFVHNYAEVFSILFPKRVR